jgi:LuxR family transcriptional activator of conjugal transfer of Ti plasmids
MLERVGEEHKMLGLSPIGITCLRWVAEGRTIREVAMIEGTSVLTVAHHLGSVCQALGTSNSVKAISTARQLKLI